MGAVGGDPCESVEGGDDCISCAQLVYQLKMHEAWNGNASGHLHESAPTYPGHVIWCTKILGSLVGLFADYVHLNIPALGLCLLSF